MHDVRPERGAPTRSIEEIDGLVASCLTKAIDTQPPRFTRGGNPSYWPDERTWARDACDQLAALGVSCDPRLDVERLAVPPGDWNPAPGKVDLHPARPGGTPGSLFVAEVKLDNINESVWDTFKLVWLAEVLNTGPQYVAVAAHDRRWGDRSSGSTLFPDKLGSSDVHCSRELIASCQLKWCSQWRRDTAKPLRVPREIRSTAVVVAHRPANYTSLELRVARIIVTDGAREELLGGVPSGLTPCASG
jgi:hypothetical protein